MSDLPVEITYGKVVGKFILATADGEDPNNLPDSAPAVGSVTFVPSQTVIKTDVPLATVFTKPLTFNLVDGELADLQSNIGVWLIAGIYRVTYTITGAALSQHNIEVLETHTDESPLNLTNAISPPGATLTLSQYTELDNRISALESGGSISANTIDGGSSSSTYIGTTPIDGGGAA